MISFYPFCSTEGGNVTRVYNYISIFILVGYVVRSSDLKAEEAPAGGEMRIHVFPEDRFMWVMGLQTESFDN